MASSTGTRGSAVLAEAARIVTEVASAGRSLDQAMPNGAQALPPAPPPAVRAVVFGSLRWYPRLERLLALLLAGRVLHPRLRSLLIVALHQLEHSRHRREVIVSVSVDAAGLVGQRRAAGLVNALLRRYLRERDALLAELASDPVASSAHPAWLLDALTTAWPADWPSIVAENNAPAPMTLRVDPSRGSRERYLEALGAAGLGASTVPWSTTALVLAQPVPVDRLPGFADGWVSVQDAGAQLAARLLGVRAGERVLDACAAPGGKTGALLEAAGPDITLTALDHDPLRLSRVQATLLRLGRSAQLVLADAAAAPDWWDGRPFDRILLDAPCSGTGVIRRHPDIKLLRRASDIGPLARLQGELLERCLMLLAPGGRLLYCTCSVLPQENRAVVEASLAARPGLTVLPLADAGPLPPGTRESGPGIQLLPGGAAQTDGFYYACLTVTSAPA